MCAATIQKFVYLYKLRGRLWNVAKTIQFEVKLDFGKQKIDSIHNIESQQHVHEEESPNVPDQLLL